MRPLLLESPRGTDSCLLEFRILEQHTQFVRIALSKPLGLASAPASLLAETRRESDMNNWVPDRFAMLASGWVTLLSILFEVAVLSGLFSLVVAGRLRYGACVIALIYLYLLRQGRREFLSAVTPLPLRLLLTISDIHWLGGVTSVVVLRVLSGSEWAVEISAWRTNLESFASCAASFGFSLSMAYRYYLVSEENVRKRS